MPRAEVGTPKYIANKMKAKGLQKLRWYCQMCQKQCRDENGFKCHTTSESHQRQLLLFADNSKRYIDDFSYQFAKEYIQILKRQFGTKRVAANKVYQEYIKDRNHLHMNATRWVTLTGFVKWMHFTGKCVADETEKGWYITYIDRDPETITREEKRNKRIKMEKDDQEKTMEFINNQVRMAKEKAGPSQEPVPSELIRQNVEEPLRLDIKLEKPSLLLLNKPLIKIEPELSKVFKIKKETPKKRTALDEIIEVEEIKKEKTNRKDYWLTEGIIVKIVTKSLGDKFYKQKGVVKEVIDRYVAVVKVLETGQKLKIDQEHLETVIPAVGKLVKIVNGAYRGEVAKLLELDEKNFCVKIEIASGLLMGRKLDNVEYEDISKVCD